MTGNTSMARAIQGIVRGMMERVMERVLQSDPFIPEKHHASKPLYAVLVPDEIFESVYNRMIC